MERRATNRVLECARLAMGFAYVRAGTLEYSNAIMPQANVQEGQTAKRYGMHKLSYKYAWR